MVVVDVETTGVYPTDRVIEIAAVTLDLDGMVVDRWDTLVNPGRDVGPSWLHGITAEMLVHAPTFEAVAGAVAMRLHGAVVSAHNLTFDARMLNAEFARIGLAVEFGVGLDTMRVARGKLGDVCGQYGIELARAHCALHDALATAELLCLVASRMEAPGWPARMPGGLAREARVLCRDDVVSQVSAPIPQAPFVAQLSSRLRHTAETDAGVVAYLDVLDRALADLHLNPDEQTELAAIASEHGLTAHQVAAAHRHYVDELIDAALDDHVVTSEEYDELLRVAASLEVDREVVHRRTRAGRSVETHVSLEPGIKVCFTGETTQHARSDLVAHAQRLGLEVVANVTKRTQLVVAADPASSSGKARKARQYAIPIVAADVFAQSQPGGTVTAAGLAVGPRSVVTCSECGRTWTVAGPPRKQSDARCEQCA